MGLSDFFKKGKKEPANTPGNISSKNVQPTPGAQPGSQGTSPFGATPASNASQDVYTVQSGDSLSKIAQKHYGNAGDWKKIYNANKKTIGENPDLIHPGQRLSIPRD